METSLYISNGYSFRRRVINVKYNSSVQRAESGFVMDQNEFLQRFQIDQVQMQAKEAVKEAESNSGGGNRRWNFPILYPSPGKVTLKLLFNTKSNSVLRIIRRHKIEGKNYPCLSAYGEECPICKLRDTLKSSLNIDASIGYKDRAIAFAQFVSSERTDGQAYTKRVGNNDVQMSPGDIVTLMMPKTVYNQLNTTLANAGDNIVKLIATNEGDCIDINRDSNNQYTSSIAPYKTYKTSNTDDEFFSILEGLPDLNQEGVPSVPSDEIRQQAYDVAGELESKYFRNQAMNNPTGYTGQPMNTQTYPNQTNQFNQANNGPVDQGGNPFANPNAPQAPQQPYQNQGQGNPFNQNQAAPQGYPTQPEQVPTSNPFAEAAKNSVTPQPETDPFNGGGETENPFAGGGNPFSNPNAGNGSNNTNPFANNGGGGNPSNPFNS